jgi:hypothetical protein
MSPSRFTAKKSNPTKVLGEGKFINTENQKDLPICSITPLFNLLELCNKLNPKSDLMECMFSMNHFQSYLFYILYDIRLSSTFSWAFFLSMWSSVFVLCCCFFSRCQYYMNYWTHPPFNCWQNILTTMYVYCIYTCKYHGLQHMLIGSLDI